MAKYDLTGSLETSFTFAIGDKEYNFRKPTVREMREVAKLFSGIEDVEDPEEQLARSEEAMAVLYRFISPINHETPIKDLMEDQTVGVQIAFNEMVKKELGAQE